MTQLDKIAILEKKMYKLLANHPYNVVRTTCDRIGRQIRELDKKQLHGE